MKSEAVIEAARQVCRDIDEGRLPRRPSLGRRVGTWALPVAIGLAGSVSGCRSNEVASPPPAATVRADSAPQAPEARPDSARADGGPAKTKDPFAAMARQVLGPQPDSSVADELANTVYGAPFSKAKQAGDAAALPEKGYGGGAGQGVGVYGAPFPGRAGQARIQLFSGRAQVGDGLPAEVIRRLMRRHSPPLRFCYEQRLREREDLEGELTVRFQIDSSGRVKGTAIEASTLGDAAVESCVAKTVAKMVFPQPKKAPVKVRFPLGFDKRPAR